MSEYSIKRIAAFSDTAVSGGNPAGVIIAEHLPSAADMQKLAIEIGFSETVFAERFSDGWTVRYYSPRGEVPFCGHATIALGAVLAMREGDGVFALSLRSDRITVEGKVGANGVSVALQSPPTYHSKADTTVLGEVMALFGFDQNDLDPTIPPAIINGGVNHFVLALNSRSKLASMQYAFDAGRDLMDRYGWITIILVYGESERCYHVRNLFAVGGVYEDPATGAAAAALAGYLRDASLRRESKIKIIQGEDMGVKSQIIVEIAPQPGSSIKVSGLARVLQ